MSYTVIDLMEHMGLTQAEVARLVGVSPRQVRDWVCHVRTNGKRGNVISTPAINTLRLLHRLWCVYHEPGRLKSKIGRMLPDALLERKP